MLANFSKAKKILGFVGLLFLGLCSIPFFSISEKEPELSKKEQNIVWLASSCVEAGYFSIKDSDVQRIPALKNKVTNAININEKELKKYEGRKGFEEWSEKGKKQAKAYSAMEKGILIANACLL